MQGYLNIRSFVLLVYIFCFGCCVSWFCFMNETTLATCNEKSFICLGTLTPQPTVVKFVWTYTALSRDSIAKLKAVLTQSIYIQNCLTVLKILPLHSIYLKYFFLVATIPAYFPKRISRTPKLFLFVYYCHFRTRKNQFEMDGMDMRGTMYECVLYIHKVAILMFTVICRKLTIKITHKNYQRMFLQLKCHVRRLL